MKPEEYVDRFRERVVQEALAQALPAYWLRRAELFEWAVSKPGDRPGTEETAEQQVKRDELLLALAQECRQRAAVRETLDGDWWGPIIKGLVEEAK